MEKLPYEVLCTTAVGFSLLRAKSPKYVSPLLYFLLQFSLETQLRAIDIDTSTCEISSI